MYLSNDQPPYFFTPKPFVIADIVFKKKIEKIQEDYLWRMTPEEEPKFWVYLNTLIKVKTSV